MSNVNYLSKWKVLILFISILLLSMVIYISKSFAADFTWTKGSDVADSRFDHLDNAPGSVRDDSGNLWVMFSAAEESTVKYYVYKGTTMDDLVFQYNSTLDSSFTKPNGDDNYWFNGLWIDDDTGTWYTTVHIEFKYYSPYPDGGFFLRTALATSTDEGRTWHNEGEILTSSNPYAKDQFAGRYFELGPGGSRLYVDTAGGYFYIFYTVQWGEISGVWSGTWTTRVARSPISQKMAPGSWSKWYNGAWSEPGLGGFDSDIFPNLASPVVFYNSYLGKFVALGSADSGGFIATATDLGIQNWTRPERFDKESRLYWYNWVVDSSTSDTMTVGQNFRVYSAQAFVNNVVAKYMPVSLDTTSSYYSGTYENGYLAQSVPDYVPGFDWTPSGAHRDHFNDGSANGWGKLSGNGTVTVENKRLKVQSNDAGSVLAYDNNSPLIADGYVSFTVTPSTNQRFKSVFRYQSATNYAGIYYHNGAIGWENGGGGTGSLINIPAFADNTVHRFDIYFSGTNYSIYMDYNLKYSGKITNMPTAAGKIGFISSNNAINYFDNIAVSASYPDNPRAAGMKPLYFYDFSSGMGGFNDYGGNGGTWAVENGELSGTTDGVNTSIAIDDTAPQMKNGYIKFNVTPKDKSNFSVIFRFIPYNTSNEIFFDEFGNIGYRTESKWGYLASDVNLQIGTQYEIEVIYQDDFVIVMVNGTTKYSGEIADFHKMYGPAEGTMGFNVFGQAHVHFDNVSYRPLGLINNFKDNMSNFRIVGGNGTWTVDDGQLNGQSHETGGNGYTTVFNETGLPARGADSPYKNGWLEFRVTPKSGETFATVFRADTGRYASVYYSGGWFGYDQFVDGVEQSVDLFYLPLADDTTHDMRILFHDSIIGIFVDGVHMYTGTPISGVTTKPGKIGFKVWNNGQVRFDNVVFLPSDRFQDDFDQDLPGAQWSWIRQNSSQWSLTANAEHLRITGYKNSELAGPGTYDYVDNILLQSAPWGDWSATVKLDTKPTSSGQQGGIVVYKDDDNYMKLTRVYHSDNQVQFATESSGIYNSGASVADSITGSIYLKITKSGNQYSAYYASDGTNFTQVWTAQSMDLTTRDNSIKIGLVAMSGSSTPYNADFDWFKVE